jgi:hypothetical protein
MPTRLNMLESSTRSRLVTSVDYNATAGAPAALIIVHPFEIRKVARRPFVNLSILPVYKAAKVCHNLKR